MIQHVGGKDCEGFPPDPPTPRSCGVAPANRRQNFYKRCDYMEIPLFFPDAVMHNWYEVFDNEEVQWMTRRRAATLVALTSLLGALTFFLLILARSGQVSTWLAGSLITSAWLALAFGAITRLQRLRRLVWCLKLSERHVVGYDYTRHKTVLAWEDVSHLALTRNGLVIAGKGGHDLEIPHLFPDYAVLSHRVMHYADRYGIPLYVNGTPWPELDVYALFPDLESLPPGPSAGENGDKLQD